MAGKASKNKEIRRKIEAEKAAKLRLRNRIQVAAILFLTLAVAGAFWLIHRDDAKDVPVVDSSAKTTSDIPSLEELMKMTPGQLGEVDVAVVNLRCAEGLAGSENLDIKASLTALDRIAERVESETERHFYRFRNKPADYENSEAYFRLLFLANIVQEDFRVRYDLSQVIPSAEEDGPNDLFFSDSRNLFIHGVLERQLGTCSSLPVFYVAVGRRLGYPLKLIAANGHYFVRWEDSRTQLNFEATSPGFVTHPDEYYRTWPAPISAKMEAQGYYLKKLSPIQELVDFMNMRALFLLKAFKVDEAMELFEKSARLLPESIHQRNMTVHFRREVARYKQSLVKASPPPHPLGDELDQEVNRIMEMGRQRRGESSSDPNPLTPPDPRFSKQPNLIYNTPPPIYQSPNR